MQNNIVRTVQLTQARRQFTERNQFRSGNSADVILERLADIDKDELLFAIDLCLELRRGDGWNLQFLRRFSVGLRNSAELVVVYQFMNRWVISANRTVGIRS